jgi:hypothetical protein
MCNSGRVFSEVWIVAIAGFLTSIQLGCGHSVPPPLKTDAKYPQHENVERFNKTWKEKPFNAEKAEVLKAQVPIGVERSRFQEALSTALSVSRSNAKTYYIFAKGEPLKEGECEMGIVVDDKTDKIIEVLIAVAHN